MKDSAKVFDEIVNERRSVRHFDTDNFDGQEAVKRSIERAILSPNSSNMQLWEFYRITSPAAKKELTSYCFNQPAAGTASELLVIVCRPDKWQTHAHLNFKFVTQKDNSDKKVAGVGTPGYYYGTVIPKLYNPGVPFVSDIAKKIFSWYKGLKAPFYREVTSHDVRVIVHKSAALSAQTFMLSMKAEGYDTCPMEGLDSKRIKQYLSLPEAAEISMVIGIGKGLPKGIYGPRYRFPHEGVVFEK
jgi:nitroreductase